MLLKRLLQLTFRILRRLRALTPDLMATETAPPAVSSEHQEPPATEASQPEAAMQRKIADHEEPPREEAPTKSSPSIPVATRGDGKRESTRTRNVYRLGLWVCQPPGGATGSLGRGTWPTRWHESTPRVLGVEKGVQLKEVLHISRLPQGTWTSRTFATSSPRRCLPLWRATTPARALVRREGLLGGVGWCGVLACVASLAKAAVRSLKCA